MVPPVAMAGGTTLITCRIPRDPANREMTFGLLDEDALPLVLSSRQVDAEDAPTLYQRYVSHLPCGVSAAFCDVRKSTGKTSRVTAPMRVIGCEP